MTRQQALYILGLPLAACETEIRIAWRKKALTYHPDNPRGNQEAFIRARSAFEYLLPPTKQSYRVKASSRVFR